jgi:DNA-binding transcriptional ArsR family regulator
LHKGISVALSERERVLAQRVIVVNLSLRIIEMIRDSYLPGIGLPDSALLLMIAMRIFQRQKKGSRTTISALSRALEMSRPTLYRRLAQLIKRGLIVKRGQSYVICLDALNRPEAVRDFKRRVAVILEGAQKLSKLDT